MCSSAALSAYGALVAVIRLVCDGGVRAYGELCSAEMPGSSSCFFRLQLEGTAHRGLCINIQWQQSGSKTVDAYGPVQQPVPQATAKAPDNT